VQAELGLIVFDHRAEIRPPGQIQSLDGLQRFDRKALTLADPFDFVIEGQLGGLDGVLSGLDLAAPRADYFWGGWVALTYDFMPHVARAEDDPSLHYALGYMGSGVSFSLHAGRRVAERIGTGEGHLPSQVSMELPRFPAAAFRRLGQRAMMRWYAFQDGRD